MGREAHGPGWLFLVRAAAVAGSHLSQHPRLCSVNLLRARAPWCDVTLP